MNPIDIIVGQNLREKRILKGLSMLELSHIVGISYQQIQKYEQGKNRISASRMVDLAASLGIETSCLFSGAALAVTQTDGRNLTEIRREHKVMGDFSQLPDEIQKIVANLVTAINATLNPEIHGAAQ